MAREIHLGDSENLPVIYLGGQELAYVYLGEKVVWANNASPVFSNVTLNNAIILEDANIDIQRNLAYTFRATLTDLETHVPYTLSLQDGDTVIASTTIATDGGTGTVVLPATYYTAADEAGPQDPARDLTLHVVDAEDADDQYAFNVDDLTFLAPSVTGSRTVTGSAASFNFGAFSVTPHPSGINLTSGITGGASSNVTVSATCGGSNSTTRSGFTTGGTATKTSGTSTFTYNRTATSNSSPSCGSYGACTSPAAPLTCASNQPTCTGSSGTQTRTCTVTQTRLCDGAFLGSSSYNESITCAANTGPNGNYIPAISPGGGGAGFVGSSLSLSEGIPSLPAGWSVGSFVWSIISGSATISNPTDSSATIESSVATSGTAFLSVTFVKSGQSNIVRTGTVSYSFTVKPLLTCATAAAGISFSSTNVSNGGSVTVSHSEGLSDFVWGLSGTGGNTATITVDRNNTPGSSVEVEVDVGDVDGGDSEADGCSYASGGTFKGQLLVATCSSIVLQCSNFFYHDGAVQQQLNGLAPGTVLEICTSDGLGGVFGGVNNSWDFEIDGECG